MKIILLLLAMIAFVHANDDSTPMERGNKLTKFFFPDKAVKDDYESSYGMPMKPNKKPMKPYMKPPTKRPYKRPGYGYINKLPKMSPPPPINIVLNLPAVPAIAAAVSTTPVNAYSTSSYTTPSPYVASSYSTPAAYSPPVPSYGAAPSYAAPSYAAPPNPIPAPYSSPTSAAISAAISAATPSVIPAAIPEALPAAIPAATPALPLVPPPPFY